MKATVLFIDDDEIERRSSTDVLKEIFADEPITIQALSPLPTLADYAKLLNEIAPSAIIVDQRLNTSSGIPYSGADLAAHLRTIGSRVPIVILTNYPDDDFTAQGWAVECIIQKKTTLRDPSAAPAIDFKRRLCRHIEVCAIILAAREHRFHELLVKSSHESLTPVEESELRQLEGERIASVVAAEREKQVQLDAEIAKLKELLGRDRLL